MSNYFDDPQVLRQIIMDHYEYPRNHSLVQDESYERKHMNSESCIDDIHVQMKLNDNVIEDIRFDGEACTISTASTSIMSELLIGKTIPEAYQIINEYFSMIDGKEPNVECLQEAIAFKNVGRQANRIKCATIGWTAIKEMLDQKKEEHYE